MRRRSRRTDTVRPGSMSSGSTTRCRFGASTHQGEAFDSLAEPFINLILANEGGVTLRGVEIGRPPTILSSGLDVDPTDGIISCESGDKTYEHGGFPKVLMMFRYKDDAGRQVTLPVFSTVFPNSSPDSVAEARKLYPFELGRDGEGRERRRCRVQPESQAHANYQPTGTSSPATRGLP